jgi:predicted aspartyl protease
VRTRIVLFLLIPFGLTSLTHAGNAQTGQPAPRASLPLSVPYETWNGLIVLKVAVRDGKPQSAILNTALSLCLATPTCALTSGIQQDISRDIDVLDRSVRITGAKPVTLHLDKLTMDGVDFGIFDLVAYLSSQKMPDAPPLWLGNSALAGFAVTIDPRQKQITFHPARSKLPAGAVIVPFELKDGRIWVEVRVNGKKTFRALLDTASVGLMIPARIASTLNLPPGAVVQTILPSGKEGKVTSVRLGEVALGDAKEKDVAALYVSEGAPDGFNSNLGILGTDFLLRYRVTIDYGQRKIALENLPPPAEPLKEDTAKDGKKP